MGSHCLLLENNIGMVMGNFLLVERHCIYLAMVDKTWGKSANLFI